MANGQISGPPAVDFYSMLSGLGDTLNANAKLRQQQQVSDARKAAFSDFTALNPSSPDYGKQALTIAQRLGSAGDQDGAVKFLGLAQTAADRTRQVERDAVADKHWQMSFGLQQRAAARADDKTPTGFAKQPDGTYAPLPGGPTDPDYLRRKEEATGGGSNVSAQVNQRKNAAALVGLTPDNPAYPSFLLTGKMPREDAQPLTATDKKAILEADEHVQAGQTAIDNLSKAKELSRSAFAGPMAARRGYAASFLGSSSDLGKGGIATTDYDNLVTTNAVGQLKAIFGGNPTEGERAILLDLQGSSNQPDEVRQKILDRGIDAARRRLQFSKQRADELRGGQYYKPQVGKQPAQASAQPRAAQQGDPLAMAKVAIQRGADPAAVRQRLIENGIDPGGL